MLLSAIMVSSVFSVALTAKQSGGKGERKLLAGQVTKQMLGTLKNYQTSDYSSAQVASWGPNANNAANRWSLEDNTVTPAIDCVGPGHPANEYALRYVGAGTTHTVRGILPTWFEAAPFNATLRYYVNGSRTSADGKVIPQISVTVDWTEP